MAQTGINTNNKINKQKMSIQVQVTLSIIINSLVSQSVFSYMSREGNYKPTTPSSHTLTMNRHTQSVNSFTSGFQIEVRNLTRK